MPNNITPDSKTSFVDPDKILFAAGLSSGQTFVDLGAGSGFYSFAAGKIVGDLGQVFAIDILEPALEHISAEARLKNLRNLKTYRANLEMENGLTEIADGSVDMIFVGNILHQIKDRKNLISLVYRLLKTGGKLVVIDWNDQPGIIGPEVNMRISKKDAANLVSKSGLRQAGELVTDQYHFGLMFIK